jgi:hypothetical protein
MEEDLVRYWGELWVKELKKQLETKKFAYAPGFKGQRGQSGISDKIASGGLRDSIEARFPGSGIIELYMFSYWRYVNDGVPPSSKYPKKGYISGGGTSPFISSLMEWLNNRFGITGDEALGRAFAIRQNIWKFGVAPSYFYSDAVEALIPKMEEEFGESYFDILEQLIVNRVIRDTNLQ